MDNRQIAASIEYETTPPPDGLPDEMKPLSGATLSYLSIKAIDGFKVTAALWQPEGKPPSDTTILVQVHGSGGNLSILPLQAIARALSPEGYAALTINTRQHDEHLNTDNFYEIRRDIEAAIATAKAIGYRSIVLQGHSLGTMQVGFYAATDWDPTIKGVILISPFANLPWKSRHVLVQNEDNYGALARAAREALKAGRVADPLPLEMRWLRGRQTPVTAQHFLTYRDDKVSTTDATFWISRIPRPILLAVGEADDVVLPFEPSTLVSAANAEGSLVQTITYVRVPDPRSPSRDGHLFVGNTQPLIDTVLDWLASQHL
jgi:pimeloyl-ACP methyl ester carboxylesterase